MTRLRLLLLVFLAVGLAGASTVSADAGAYNRARTGQTPQPRPKHPTLVQATKRAPLSSLGELQKRIGYSATDVGGPEDDYRIANESFGLFVPPSYDGSAPHGVLVWISASPSGQVIPVWRRTLARHRIIWIGANRSGNGRTVPVRVNLGLDAAHYVQTHYNVDPRRIYVGGDSGGGKSASKAALLYPEVFAGGLFVIGADYYRSYAVKNSPGQSWPSGFPRPQIRRIERAKHNSFVLVTGEHDPNRANITDIYRAYRKDGFTHVELRVVRGLGHGIPGSAVFEDVLPLLDSL